MSVAVIGGAGFIGSHIVDELMVGGQEVTVLDNLSEGKMENLARWKGHKRFEFVRGDIRDYDVVRRVCDHKFAVFHLGAMSRIQPSIVDPLLAFSQNFMGTANVAEACRQGEVKRLVYSASSSAYGRANDWALNDTVDPGDDYNEAEMRKAGLTEDLPTDCLNPYSLSKKVGEEIMDLYQKFYGLSTVSLRYFNVYGPRHQEEGSYATVIAIFRKQKRDGKKLTVVGDGTQRRDFTFVSDVVRANMFAMMNIEASGVYNVGAGENYSINDVAAMIGGEIEHITPRLGEAKETLASWKKAHAVLGWAPTVTLHQGLELIEKYEQVANRSNIIVVGA